MQDPFQPLLILLQTEEVDLRVLATSLGCDPATFYIGTDLTGVDLRGQDLRQMRFDRTNLLRANIDPLTKFDSDILEVVRSAKSKRYLEISKELLDFCRNFFSVEKFRSTGWFIKSLVPAAALEISRNPLAWTETIEGSPEFKSFFGSIARRRTELLLNDFDYEAGGLVGSHFGGWGANLTALIVVGLMKLIDYQPEADFRPLTRDALLREFRAFPQFHSRYL